MTRANGHGSVIAAHNSGPTWLVAAAGQTAPGAPLAAVGIAGCGCAPVGGTVTASAPAASRRTGSGGGGSAPPPGALPLLRGDTLPGTGRGKLSGSAWAASSGKLSGVAWTEVHGRESTARSARKSTGAA